MRKIPVRLLMTALHNAVATEIIDEQILLRLNRKYTNLSFHSRMYSPLPPAADVSRMHMFMVVGRQHKISKPSSRGAGRS